MRGFTAYWRVYHRYGWQRRLPSGGSHFGSDCGRNTGGQWPAKVRHRLAGSASGQYPHYPSHSQETRNGYGTSGSDDRQAWQHFRRLHPLGIGYGGARWPHSAWRDRPDGSLRWWIYLGFGVTQVLETYMKFAFLFPGQGSQSVGMM